jgi:hypothetical protein
MVEIAFIIATMLSSAISTPSIRTDSFQVTADGGAIRFEMGGINATASRVSYNGLTGAVLLEGTRDSLVTLRRTDGHPSELSARKITISAKGGETKAEGIQSLDFAPSGRLNLR